MYISVTQNEEKYYQEGFVIRFYKNDQTDWVANFKPGINDFNKVFNFPLRNRIVVFAGGTCYIMNPNIEKPTLTFGIEINCVFQSENGSLICVDSIGIQILDNNNGELWTSERISIDGFKDLTLENDILIGKSFDPMNSFKEWNEFSLNIKTKEIKGGSFREMMQKNRNLEMKNRIEIKEKSIKKKWQFWK